MIPVGAGGIGMAATANATIQLHVPDGLRGRVMSVYTTVFAASVPIGGLATGLLASTIGVLPTVFVGGALSVATGIGATIWYRRIRAASAAATAPAPATAGRTASPQPTAAAGSPNTRAAFKPPKPKDVLSTRR
jgi:MFS family permease